MIYGRMGGIVRLIRVGTAKDAALDRRTPDNYDRERAKIGYLMVGRFVREDGTESEDRLFDLALLRADNGWDEIKQAAIAAGNKKLK
jgi:hypothetical protein